MNISPVGNLAAAPFAAGGGNEAKIKELEKKLAHLTEEKKKAQENHDVEKAQKLEQEIQKVKQELEELKRKVKKEEEDRKDGQSGQKEQVPPDGITGQYLNTWA